MPNSAEILREERYKRRKAEYECRQTKALMEYYLSISPDIAEYAEYNKTLNRDIAINKDEDVSKRYLSTDEYSRLSTTERNQLALDRFWTQTNKSKSLIGKLYEQYVGYLYEKIGCEVEYFGITKGYSDLGRDLICKKGRDTLLIQCKNWSRSKTIYEKHIFQLFGTTYQYAKEHPKENVHAAFFTTTCLSDTARSFAKDFNIKLYEDFKLQQFPIIKCNVNKNGERIYHLPFDQQYDVTKIKVGEGDRYCMTVKEAEDLGFRRAYRWNGLKN